MSDRTYLRLPISKRTGYDHEIRLLVSEFNDKEYYHIREFYRKNKEDSWMPGTGWSLNPQQILDLAWGLEVMLVFEDKESGVYKLISDDFAERLKEAIESEEEIDYQRVAEKMLPAVLTAGNFISQIKEAQKRGKH